MSLFGFLVYIIIIFLWSKHREDKTKMGGCCSLKQLMFSNCVGSGTAHPSTYKHIMKTRNNGYRQPMRSATYTMPLMLDMIIGPSGSLSKALPYPFNEDSSYFNPSLSFRWWVLLIGRWCSLRAESRNAKGMDVCFNIRKARKLRNRRQCASRAERTDCASPVIRK